jgi:Cyclin, N-terminal domain
MQPHTPSGSDDAKISLERRRSLRLRHSNLSLDSASSIPNRLLTDSPVIKQRKRRSTTTSNEASNFQRKRPCENDDDSSFSNRKLTSDLNTVTPLVTSKVNEKSFLSRLNESKESPKHGKVPNWMIRSIISPDAKKLPPGVIDLYSFDDYNRVCSCDDDHCSCQSLSHVYLRHYGAKYYQYLKDWEDLNWPTIAAKSSRLYGGNSSTDEDSSSSASSSRISRHIQHVMGNITSDDEQSLDLSITSQQLEHQPHLTEKMRAVLVDWLIELSEEYKLSLRTLHLTIALINRSLECGQEGCSRRLVIERDMFQCLGWYVNT